MLKDGGGGFGSKGFKVLTLSIHPSTLVSDLKNMEEK